MDDQVGKLDGRGDPLGIRRVVALDRGRDRRGQAPAANEDGADEGVVDSQLAALAAKALFGPVLRLRAHPELLAVEVAKDEAADVVD